MKSFLALMKREYLEHRGAFLYAPAVLTGLLALFLALSFLSNRTRIVFDEDVPSVLKFFEFAYLIFAAGWWLYLSAALLFYFAGAFHADRRNNAMLFWKSMPLTDFRILLSKAVAGLTQFPAMILVAVFVTGLLLALTTIVVGSVLPGMASPAIGTLATSWMQISWFAVFYFALALLWYAPFFAWVGAIATMVGRWAIPLALLTPLLLVMFENILFFGNSSNGGLVWGYLSHRMDFGFSESHVMQIGLANPQPFDAMGMSKILLTTVDWTQMALGLGFGLAVIYAASQYRRRRLDT